MEHHGHRHRRHLVAIPGTTLIIVFSFFSSKCLSSCEALIKKERCWYMVMDCIPYCGYCPVIEEELNELGMKRSSLGLVLDKEKNKEIKKQVSGF